MKTGLLRIRLLQLNRLFNGSWFFLFAIGLVILSGSFVCYKLFLEPRTALIISALVIVLCFQIHHRRTDLDFVRLHLPSPYIQLLVEYFAFTLPFMLGCLLTPMRYLFILYILLIGLLPLYRPARTQNTRLASLSRFIPASQFEWISGIRKSYSWLIPLYLLCIGLSWVRVLPLFLLWIITMTIASWYTEFEPLHLLRAAGKTPAGILLGKLKFLAGRSFLLYLPVLITQLYFYPELWLVLTLFIPVQWALLAFALFLKYHHYVPSQQTMESNIIFSLIALGALLPFLLPLPVLMAVFYYSRAKQNLQTYLV